MATGNTLTTQVSVLIPTMKASALVAFQETGPMRQLVHNYPMSAGSLTLPNYGTISVSSLAEGVTIGTTQQMALTSATLTSGRVGGKIFLSDQAINRALKAGNEDLVAEASRELGMAIGNNLDESIVDLFSGIDNGVGAAASELTVAGLGAAIATLRTNLVPLPYFAVLHPYQAYALFSDLKVPSTNASRDIEAVTARPFFEGYCLGVPVYVDANIDIDGSGDAYGALLNADALALGVETDISIEVERAPANGYYIYGFMDYAVVERKGTYGCYMLYDSAI